MTRNAKKTTVTTARTSSSPPHTQGHFLSNRIMPASASIHSVTGSRRTFAEKMALGD